MQTATEFLDETKKQIDFTFTTRVVIPGDDVTPYVTSLHKKIKIGGGLIQKQEQVFAQKAGVLRYRPPNRYWVDYTWKRYIAAMDDHVIGVIEDRNVEYYKVNIGGSSAAVLPTLAFDGATKRNRPNLQIGSLIYARVKRVTTAMDPELTCEAPSNAAKKDWMTGECLYGELHEGYAFKCSVNLTKRLTKENCALLTALGQSVPFEIAVGVNGFVWVKSGSTEHTILISNAILNCETLTDAQSVAMVDQLIVKFKDRMVKDDDE